MSLCVPAGRGRSAFLVRGVLLVIIVALLSVCALPAQVQAQAATATDLKNNIRERLSRINSGMLDFYSALGATPTVQQQFCTMAVSNKAPGLSLTMESTAGPYHLLATDEGLVIFKDDYVFGPSIELIGASAQVDGTLTTNIQSGSSIVVPYTANTIIFVVGIISHSSGSMSILPMARYMLVDGYRCTGSSMNVADLYSNTFSRVFQAMAA